MNFNISEELKKLPLSPGVYIMHGSKDEILYVGKAKKLRNRVSSYFRESAGHSTKIAIMVKNVAYFEYILTDSEVEALILENNLIKQYRPPYNTRLKDDKTYPYIKVTIKDVFPRVFLTRDYKKDGSKYYGPYTNVHSAREIIEIVRKLYKIRTCNRNLPKDIGKERPCLYNHIGECDAPCAGLVDEATYNRDIDKVLSFLNGNYEGLVDDLVKEMNAYSENLDFEKAANIRDKINAVKQLSIKQKIVLTDDIDRDVIGFYRLGGEMLIQVFFVRAGKLIAKERFSLDDLADTSDDEVLASFVKQFYSGISYIPREIVLGIDLSDSETIAEWLSEKKDAKCSIKCAMRGEKYKLVKMANLNAQHILDRHNEKIKKEQRRTKDVMKELAELLGMDGISRIESFDISNISGAYSVGSMVVFNEGKPKRSDYRKFRIKDVVGPDDYASMEEVLTRRFKRALKEQRQILKKELKLEMGKFNTLPDLILMDGGKGQISVAKKVLASLGLDIAVCGMVKDDKHRTRALIFEGATLEISKNTELFKFITRVQDETHRFAITYHSKIRSDEMVRSVLDEIKGVGEKRRKALLKEFGSVKNIKQQSAESLSKVEGISEVLAKEIYDFFNA